MKKIKRIVKLTFAPENIVAFENLFKTQSSKIKAMQGCLSLELLQDISNPHIFFTYSSWEDEKYLQDYRKSDLFEKVWAETKALFNGKPEAWSVVDVG
jgi:quinol monooxygenase YgiN